MRRTALLPTLCALFLLAGAGGTAFSAPDLTVDAARDTTPVVLSGKDLGTWAAPANQTVHPPLMDLADCPYTVDPNGFGDPTENGAGGVTDGFKQECKEGYDPHNHYAKPLIDSGDAAGRGT